MAFGRRRPLYVPDSRPSSRGRAPVDWRPWEAPSAECARFRAVGRRPSVPGDFGRHFGLGRPLPCHRQSTHRDVARWPRALPFIRDRRVGMRPLTSTGRGFLTLLKDLPRLPAVLDDELMTFIDVHRLMGRGLGWIDVHLLAAAFVSRQGLWTKDRRLADAAKRLGVIV